MGADYSDALIHDIDLVNFDYEQGGKVESLKGGVQVKKKQRTQKKGRKDLLGKGGT